MLSLWLILSLMSLGNICSLFQILPRIALVMILFAAWTFVMIVALEIMCLISFVNSVQLAL